MTGASPRAPAGAEPRRRGLFRRGPWEMAASVIIGLGVLMLMQPFFLWAFSWSFAVTLAGTATFMIVSHFPE